MPALDLVYAPNPIFKQKADAVDAVDDATKAFAQDLLDTMYHEQGLGLGANMVGVLKRIAVVDLQDGSHDGAYVFINPRVVWQSEETQTHKEMSLSFPGIDADITRPKAIELAYQDLDGQQQTLKATDWLAQVILHEIEYLDGKTFLDHLKPMKRQMLVKKMQKYKRLMDKQHVHGPGCGTGCNH